jgi:hypothetical protein
VRLRALRRGLSTEDIVRAYGTAMGKSSCAGSELGHSSPYFPKRTRLVQRRRGSGIGRLPVQLYFGARIGRHLFAGVRVKPRELAWLGWLLLEAAGSALDRRACSASMSVFSGTSAVKPRRCAPKNQHSESRCPLPSDKSRAPALGRVVAARNQA